MKKLLLIVFVAVIFFSCTDNSTDPVNNPNEEVITQANIIDFRNANLEFANNIFKQIAVEDSNVMISPVSISIALSMLNNGAGENTKTEIKSILEYDNVPDHCINKLFQELLIDLSSLNEVIDLKIANSAWFDTEFEVLQSFIDVNKEFYNAEVRNIDLQAVGTVDSINTWVSNKTDGKITEIIEIINPLAAFFLLNAIDFQGYWKFPFDPDATENAPFTDDNGNYSNVTAMMDNGINDDAPCKKFKYLVTDAFQAVKMPYGIPDSTKSSNDVSMYVFVPDTTLAVFIDTELTTSNWNSWIDSFISFDDQYPEYEYEFNFILPKFKFGFEKKLIPVLQSMGLIDAFDPISANFSDITDCWDGLYIDVAKHKSFIDVNEEGTSAAAVTIIGGSYTSNIPNFSAIKPFLFVITDELTGTILFMGQVYNPEYE